MILPPAAAARFNVLQFMYPLQWSASGSLERSKRAFLIHLGFPRDCLLWVVSRRDS